MSGKYDILWKGMLEEVFADFLRFIDPEIDRELDMSRGVVFMDKELAEMYPEPEKRSGTRSVDKLAKVYLRDGGERYMLLHVEVQGKNEHNFPARMFQYYYRILDREGKDVAAVAILTGWNGNNVPDKYERRCLWGRILYEYKTVCIADYPDEVLAVSDNPFAAVMMVAKEAIMKLKGTDEETDAILLEHKMMIFRLLKEKNIEEDKRNSIMTFLNNYRAFKKTETNRTFKEQIDRETGKINTMGIIEQLAEIKREEGLEEGLKKGRKEERKNRSQLFVENLLKESDFSVEKIASLVDVTPDFVTRIKEGLKAK